MIIMIITIFTVVWMFILSGWVIVQGSKIKKLKKVRQVRCIIAIYRVGVDKPVGYALNMLAANQHVDRIIMQAGLNGSLLDVGDFGFDWVGLTHPVYMKNGR